MHGSTLQKPKTRQISEKIMITQAFIKALLSIAFFPKKFSSLALWGDLIVYTKGKSFEI